MENKNSTRSIVEAGLMSAMVLVLMLLNAYVPVLGYMGLFILPLPITMLVVRQNLKVASISVVASAILISFILNPITAVGTLLRYGLAGLTLGYCIKSNKNAVVSIAIQSVAIIIGTIIDASLYIYLTLNSTLYKVAEMNVNMMKEAIETSKNLYKSIGVDIQSNPLFKAMEVFNVDMLFLMIPAILIMSAFMMSYINYVITKQIFKKMKIELAALPKFNYWYFDNRLTAVIIIIACLGIILGTSGVKAGEYITATAIFVLQMIFLIIGVSVLTFFLRDRFKVPKALLVVIILFTIGSFGYFYAILGFTDSIMDMRGLDPNSIKNTLAKRFKKK